MDSAFNQMPTAAARPFPTLDLPIAHTSPTSVDSVNIAGGGQSSPSASFVHALSLDHAEERPQEREFKKDGGSPRGQSLLMSGDQLSRAHNGGVFHSISISESDGGIDGVDDRHLPRLSRSVALCCVG